MQQIAERVCKCLSGHRDTRCMEHFVIARLPKRHPGSEDRDGKFSGGDCDDKDEEMYHGTAAAAVMVGAGWNGLDWDGGEIG